MNSTVIRHYVDKLGMPEWGAGPDGRPVKLKQGEALQRAYDAWMEGACQHPETFIHARKDSLGRPFFKRMCRCCGIALSSMLAEGAFPGEQILSPSVERVEARQGEYQSRRQAERDAFTKAAAANDQPDNRQEYAEYLSTPAWEEKRAKVLKRAGGLCEGCGDHSSSEVHHLTYLHKGAEFLFELVALCRGCHSRYHKDAA